MTGHPGEEEPRLLRFLSLEQVVAELNPKEFLVRALITTGELPAIQIGGWGLWLIERESFEGHVTAAYAKACTAITRGNLDTPAETPKGENAYPRVSHCLRLTPV